MKNATYKEVKPAKVTVPVDAKYIDLTGQNVKVTNENNFMQNDETKIICDRIDENDHISNEHYMKKCICSVCGKLFFTSADAVSAKCVKCEQKSYRNNIHRKEMIRKQGDYCEIFHSESDTISSSGFAYSWNDKDEEYKAHRRTIKKVIILLSIAVVISLIALSYIFINEIVWFCIHYVFRYAAWIACVYCVIKAAFPYRRVTYQNYMAAALFFLVIAIILGKWTL